MSSIDLDLTFQKINELYVQKEYEKAIENLDKILDIDPGNLVGIRNKGIVLVNLSKYEKAIEFIDRLLEKNPNDHSLLSRKGFSLEILGKHLEALECINKTLDIDPGNCIS